MGHVGKMIRWTRTGGREGMPVVVSFYTGGLYARDAYELARSCDAHGLDYDIRQVPDLRDWRRNTSFKPTFLREVAAEYPRRALLWLDADARVRKDPCLFDGFRADLAYHALGGHHALSGTVFLGAGPRRDEFLARWQAECAVAAYVLDQEAMEKAAKALGIQNAGLPVEYTWIWDFDGGERAKPVEAIIDRPVIEHMQASRWARNR